MIYTKEYLNNLADSINRRFYPERLVKPIPLDVYDLLEKIGCEIEWKYLSPCDDILGLTCFDNTCWYIWPHNTLLSEDKPILEPFKQGTVIINQILLDKNDRLRENFVVCHEAMHWLKDKDYFLGQHNDLIQICHKNCFEKTYWNHSQTQLEVIESQTNYLAAALLLPKEVLKSEFYRIGRYKNIPRGPIKYEVYMKKWIVELSKIYKVNFNPILYRLYDIEVLKRN